MWRIECIRPDKETLHWSGLMDDSGNLSFDRVRSSWKSDRNFRSFWIASLRTLPFDAYCWECPPVWTSNVNRPFECVFVSSPSLARMPQDSKAFAEHFPPGSASRRSRTWAATLRSSRPARRVRLRLHAPRPLCGDCITRTAGRALGGRRPFARIAHRSSPALAQHRRAWSRLAARAARLAAQTYRHAAYTRI